MRTRQKPWVGGHKTTHKSSLTADNIYCTAKISKNTTRGGGGAMNCELNKVIIANTFKFSIINKHWNSTDRMATR